MREDDTSRTELEESMTLVEMLRPSPTLQGKTTQTVYTDSNDLFEEGGDKNDETC